MGITLMGIAAIVLSIGISLYFISLSLDVRSVTKARTVVYSTNQEVTVANNEYMSDQDEEDEFVKAIQSKQFYKDFDARIERMKMEMAEDNIYDTVVTEAEELHPLVKNLPHSEVNEELLSRVHSKEEVSY